MLSGIITRDGEAFAHNPALRGYHAVYREHQVNHCPGCGRTHWYIGRVMAECAFCSTALPLETAPLIAGGQIIRHARRYAFADSQAVAA